MTEAVGVRIPTPEPLSLRDNPLENIRYFRHQWKYFCVATGLDRMSNEKKVATFFLYIGREAFTFINDNLELSCEEMSDCDRILTALENRHKPRTNITYQRFLFHQTVQEPTDTIDNFVEKLQKLAEQCGFKDRIEEMIRDRFVVGLVNKEIQSELLSNTELSLSKAVRISKREELKQADEVRLLNQRVDNTREIPNNAHSTTTHGANIRLSPEGFIKLEKVDDDDDLMIVSHSRSDFVTSSNRAAKRIKLEPENDGEVSHIQTINVEESDLPTEASSTMDMKVGSFVVLKEDWHKLVDPPIWKVDSTALLQKFIPIEHNGSILYKSTAVYSGWTVGVKDKYYKATVILKNKQFNKKETIVQFQKDLVPIENQFEKVNGNYM